MEMAVRPGNQRHCSKNASTDGERLDVMHLLLLDAFPGNTKHQVYKSVSKTVPLRKLVNPPGRLLRVHNSARDPRSRRCHRLLSGPAGRFQATDQR
jgi:hypothetical protein